jgi:hypothetical protein
MLLELAERMAGAGSSRRSSVADNAVDDSSAVIANDHRIGDNDDKIVDLISSARPQQQSLPSSPPLVVARYSFALMFLLVHDW